MKICKKCGVEKLLIDFYIHPYGMKDGHMNFCKECVKERIRNRSRSPEGRQYDRIKAKTEKRKEWKAEYRKKLRLKYPEKVIARDRVYKAIQKGLLVKKPCAFCDIKTVQGHHPDYSKPLEVIWLCPVHHRAIHKQFQRKQ